MKRMVSIKQRRCDIPKVDIPTNVGGMALKLPILTEAFGSTDVARINWEGFSCWSSACWCFDHISRKRCWNRCRFQIHRRKGDESLRVSNKGHRNSLADEVEKEAIEKNS